MVCFRESSLSQPWRRRRQYPQRVRTPRQRPPSSRPHTRQCRRRGFSTVGSDLECRAGLPTGSSFVLDIGGVAPVPAGATAVVLNVTATNPDGPSFVSAWPADKPQPTTSVINFESPGQTIANLVTVPMDAAGGVAFFTQTGTRPDRRRPGLLRAGRVEWCRPFQTDDTESCARHPPAQPDPHRTGSFRTERRHRLPTVGRRRRCHRGRPQRDRDRATAARVLDRVRRRSAATGSEQPQRRRRSARRFANQVITPIAGGSASFFSQSGGHLIVDIAGYYTGASTAAGTDGLFVPVSPYRLVDTRDPANGGRTSRRSARRSRCTSRGGPASRPGRCRGRRQRNRDQHDGCPGSSPCGRAGPTRPVVSNLNAVHVNQTIANHATIAGDRCTGSTSTRKPAPTWSPT